jgi:hypothetical protein
MAIIGEDELGNVIQMDSKGNVSPNAYPPAPNKPTEPPKNNEPEMPLEDDDPGETEEGIQPELIFCDIWTVGGDIVSFFGPVGLVVGTSFSIIGSGLGWILTNNDYNHGRASVKDLDVATYNFWAGLIPYAGIGAGVAQLLYDLKIIK